MVLTVPLKTLKILPHETERDCIIIKDNGRKDFHKTLCTMQNLQEDHFIWIENFKKNVEFF